MDNVRILRGYSKEEQRELEDDEEFVSCTTFINIITGYQPAFECRFIKDKYDNAREDEQILIIKDIIDFYTGKAKFVDPKKYYVQLIAGDEESYLNINPNGGAKLYNRLGLNGWKVKFTIDEIAKINPQLVLFMEEVEDDE